MQNHTLVKNSNLKNTKVKVSNKCIFFDYYHKIGLKKVQKSEKAPEKIGKQKHLQM